MWKKKTPEPQNKNEGNEGVAKSTETKERKEENALGLKNTQKTLKKKDEHLDNILSLVEFSY
jgi:hypothetical protein